MEATATLPKTESFNLKISNYSLAIATFFLLYSTAITNIFIAVSLLSYLIKPKKLNNPITFYIITLIILAFSSIIYTSSNTEHIIFDAKKTIKWFLIPILIANLKDENNRKNIIYAFIASVTLLLIIAIPKYFKIIYFDNCIDIGIKLCPKGAALHITTPIYTSAFVIFYAYLMMYGYFNSKYKWLCLTLTLAAIYYVYVMADNRTAYVFGIPLLLFGMLYQTNFKKIIPLIAIVGIVLSISTYDILLKRTNETIEHLSRYQTTQDSTTSVGQRIEYYKNSFEIWKSSPILGYGIGSFKLEYEKYATQNNFKPTTNPHNQYLLILVNFGILGLAIGCITLYQLFKIQRNFPHRYRYAFYGIVIMFSIGGLLNSWLTDFATQYFCIIAFSLIFSNWNKNHAAQT